MNGYIEAKARIAEVRRFGGDYIDAALEAARKLDCDLADLLDDPLSDDSDDLELDFEVDPAPVPLH